MELIAEPARPVYDQPFTLRLVDAPPGDSVALDAALIELDGSLWRSAGDYAVDADGLVADPMRVIWSAEPAERGAAPDGAWVEVHLTATRGRESASATVMRSDPSVGTGIEPADPDIVGCLYLPPAAGLQKSPAVLFLGGAEGGFHRRHPALIARHGFAVLSLAYFGYPRQPSLVDVPLERFGHALRWLLGRPEVRGRRAITLGGSFGGQAAPLIAATFPELVCGSVAISGSGVVTNGIPGHPTLLGNFLDPRAPFALDGRPLDFIHGTGAEFERQCRSDEAVEMRLAFETALQDRQAVERAAIPVENIEGPLLFLSGADDRQWPCVALSEVAVERRQRAGLAVEHVVYPGAGHGLIPPPYGPTTTRLLPPFRQLMGGSPAVDAAAREDVWRRILAFLAAHAGH